MQFVNRKEARILRAIAALTDCNPFLPERIEFEKAALGQSYIEAGEVWHMRGDLDSHSPNVAVLREQLPDFVASLQDRLQKGASATSEELLDYEALVRHHLFFCYESVFDDLIAAAERDELATKRVDAYDRYAKQASDLLHFPDRNLPFQLEPAHIFAWGFQIRRAFWHIFRYLSGSSYPMAKLRAAIWQSIFTHNAQRYRRSLFKHMADVPTLIIGESGTGKEIAARAIGLSRYIAFHPKSRSFAEDYQSSFFSVNLSALPPALIESELFGHKKGAFTGATNDRIGWFESCGSVGTIFLDEIGELAPEIQVKLLRILQTREFQRSGETRSRKFRGKIIAATNRNLAEAVHDGELREDFFYRLSGDIVRTPSLREQLSEQPQDLEHLILALALRLTDKEDAAVLAGEALRWIRSELSADYSWPGNVRELEQCVRSILIRGDYRPPQPDADAATSAETRLSLITALRKLRYPADELMRDYCTAVYAEAGSYEEAARRLELDRRTVKSKIDPDRLELFQD